MADIRADRADTQEIPGFYCDNENCGRLLTPADFAEWKFDPPKPGQERQDWIDDHGLGTFGHWQCIME